MTSFALVLAFMAGVGGGLPDTTDLAKRSDLVLAQLSTSPDPIGEGDDPDTSPDPETPPRGFAREGGEGAGRTAGGGASVLRAGQAVLAPSGNPEILLAGSKAQLDAASALVADMGGVVLRRKSHGNLGIGTLALDSGGQFSLAGLQGKLRGADIAVKSGWNTLYVQSSEPRLYAGELIGSGNHGGCRLPNAQKVGLIDGPVDTGASGLRGANIVTHSVLPAGEPAGSTSHATAVASLIVAPPGGQGSAGFAIGAQLYAVTAFGPSGSRDLAQVDTITEGLDWLLGKRVSVIGLPFTGPQNDILATVLGLADAQGAVMVAPVGNNGQGTVGFPAADAHVIAVTAVDAKKRLYSRANQGSRTDFSAPGVELYLPASGGFGYQSGTSFAAGIVTALAAQQSARGASGRAAVIQRLRSQAEDLGSPGRDTKFGYGLVRADGC